MMILAKVDAGILNEVLGKNIEILTSSLSQVQASASGVLLSLATIEIAMLGISALFSSGPNEVIADLFKKSVLIAVFFFLVSSWGQVANQIKEYVVGSAAQASGQSSTQLALNPSYIAEQGVQKVAFIFSPQATAQLASSGFSKQAQNLAGPSGAELLFGDKPALEALVESSQLTAMTLLMGLTFMVLALLIIAAHFYVAMQIYVTTIEFYVVVALSVLFVPFGVNRHTSFLANQAFQAVIAQAVKLGVMVLLVGAFGPLIQKLELSSQPTLYELLSMLLGVSTFAYVIARAPSVAQVAFSGAGGGIDVYGTMHAAGSLATSAVSGGAASVAAGAARAATGSAGATSNAQGSPAPACARPSSSKALAPELSAGLPDKGGK